ncbi:hypothetical protein Gotri_011897 [Gossypium trilobum]|uniref:Protein kinase domain-containing protein n=1 Tax=Gossypium trilobum TaxID=34281 RepID=A0A7J9FUQ0_9ROSI|nr:hypothetical protein [Gossypium trilobum]
MVYNMFLEYVPRGSLLDLMHRYGGKIPERDVNCYTQMILEGLLDIHEKGYIHSNLKPGNILVFPLQHGTGLSTLKIADFGLAKQQEIKDTRSGFRGTRRLPWDTCDGDELRDKLLRGESPNIPKDMSKLE